MGETSNSPTWSPDSTQLAFASNHVGGASTIHIVNADGTGERHISGIEEPISHPAWHPDGSEILVGSERLWTISPDGQDTRELPQPGLHWSHEGTGVAWSPDASTIAMRIGPEFKVVTVSRYGDDLRLSLVEDTETGRAVRPCNRQLRPEELFGRFNLELCQPAEEQSP